MIGDDREWRTGEVVVKFSHPVNEGKQLAVGTAISLLGRIACLRGVGNRVVLVITP